MNNPGLTAALRDRCSIGNITNLNLHLRNLTFTHIPKCGGSSLRFLLNKHFKARFQPKRANMGPHVPFFLSQKQHPRNIFFTVMREPTSLAISLYNYINMHKSMPKHLMHDKFWMNSYNRDPVDWSKDTFIRKTLRNQVLRFFTWHRKAAKSGVSDGSGDFSNPQVCREFQSLPETYNRVLDPWVPLTPEQEEGVSNYSLTMPGVYRCTSELKVVLILIQRYSAVGVVENYQQFFHVLHHRAQLDDAAFLAMMDDSSEIKNPSSSKISTAKLKVVKSNLHEIFFCSRVLWRLASVIGNHDMSCYSSHSS
jgi:hypothetical protein